MKINSMLAIMALASLMAIPFSASAQSRDRDSKSDHASHDRQTGRSRNEDRRQTTSNRQSDSRSSDRQSGGWNRQDNNRQETGRQQDRNWSRNVPTTSSRDRHVDDRRDNDRNWNRDNDRNWNRDNDRNWNRDNDRNWDRNRDRDGDRDWRRDDHDYDRGGYYIGGSNRNEWRDVAITFGVVGLIGLLDHDDFLTFSGSAGALYAIWRYDEDSHCSDSYRRARAHYFSLPFFYRDGCRYERRTVVRDGERYYQFVRCD